MRAAAPPSPFEPKRHQARVGLEAWGQHDDRFFGLTARSGANVIEQAARHWASSTAVFAEDQYRATPWLNFELGIRFTHYAGLVTENAADPRLGASLRIPRLAWVLHGYYQPPPLDSLAGPTLDFTASRGFGFIPLG